MMIRVALRDLSTRWRRFVTTVAGAGLVLGMSILMDGLITGFDHETRSTVTLAGADGWIVAAGIAGPFTTTSLLDQSLVEQVDAGVGQAAPILVARQSLLVEGREPTYSIVLGVEPGKVGDPLRDAGSPLGGIGVAIVDTGLGLDPGDTIGFGGERLRVVAEVDASLFAGAPVVFVPIEVARRLAVDGAELSSAVLTTGPVGTLPPGVRAMTGEEVMDDALEPLDAAKGTIALVRSLLWLVAALIVASVLYLSALERSRDVAVFKAIGVPTRSIVAGTVAQAAVVAVLAVGLASLVAAGLGPRFPLPVVLGAASNGTALVVALAVGAVGSIGGVRRAIAISPHEALAAT